MKILITAWNVFSKSGDELFVSRNGGSIMIHDICEYIGRKEETFLLVGSIRVDECVYGNIRVLDNQAYLPQERNAQNINEWQSGLNKIFIEYVKQIKPDIVLVQGGGEYSENCIDSCEMLSQKYAFVDHSYFGKGEDGYDKGIMPEWEERIFSKKNINVIMVGNGMKNRMLKDYPNFPIERICAIPNGTAYSGEYRESSLISQYNLENKKVLICVGRIYKRKNQLQLPAIFQYLPANMRDSIRILICGTDSPNDPGLQDLKAEIERNHANKQVIYIGSRNEEEMKALYSVADGLIMPSLSEGLSLVALEMLTYGKPIIMFEDNETGIDVNDSCGVVFAKNRSDKALADAVIHWYESEWDGEKIKAYSKIFSMERVAEDYINYCREQKRDYR